MEFAPIYAAGFHDISLVELEEIFVIPFPENERRAYLTKRFRDYLNKFSELGLKVEIWIDGSYSTIKPEPGDMDILIIFDADAVNHLPDEKKPVLEELFDRDVCKIRYSIDVLLCDSNNIDMRSYWRGWFGFSRDEKPKGIPRVNYGHGID
jgi:hypothetical protein